MYSLVIDIDLNAGRTNIYLLWIVLYSMKVYIVGRPQGYEILIIIKK